MKLNIANVAKRLRWSYITPEQAKAKGIKMDRWQKLVQARQKFEKIFYGAGGKPENLKKAILNGKGNKNHEVHGLDGFGRIYDHRNGRFHKPMMAHGVHPNQRLRGKHPHPIPVRMRHFQHVSPMHPNHPINFMNEHTPLRHLLGEQMFFSENSVGTLGELGEPVSMTMIAAASGVIAAIAKTLKKIGDIFGGKGKGSEDFDEKANADAEKEIPQGSGNTEDSKAADSITDNSSSGGSSSDSSSGGSSSSSGGSDDNSDGGSAPPVRRTTNRTSYNSSGAGGGSAGGGGGDDADTGGGGSSAGGGSAGGGRSSSGGGGGSSSGGGGGGGSTDLAPSGGGGDEGGAAALPAKSSPQDSADDGGSKDDPNPKSGFFEKNKKWIMPVGIGIGVISVGALIAKAMKPPTPSAPAHKPMHGIPRKNHHRSKPKAKPKAKPTHAHKTKSKTKKRTVKRGKLEAVMIR